MRFEFVQRNRRKILMIIGFIGVRFLFKRWGDRLTRKRAERNAAERDPVAGEEATGPSEGQEATSRKVDADLTEIRKRR
jgi:hypothetical protein